ncbi:MAG: polysaccharide pyruvyl transferase family protein [Cyanobacteria bacterium J06632_22]
MGRVLICGYYGHYNLGDEAMLAGMLALLRQWQPNIAATVYSNDPADTVRRHGVNTVSSRPPRRRLERWQRQVRPYGLLLGHRWFVLGGGDLLRDGPRAGVGAESVAEVWLRPLQQAIRLRRRTLVWGVSVGHLWRQQTRDRIRVVLNQTTLIAVRDRNSQTALRELGIHAPIVVMPDLALFAPRVPQADSIASAPHPPRIGVSLRSLANRMMPQGAGPAQITDARFTETQFTQAMAGLLDALVAQYGAEVHLFPLQSFPEDYRQRHRPAVDDYRSSLAVLAHCQHSMQMVLHPYFPSLADMTQQMGCMDLILGTRLHAAILAARQGIPVIAAAYDPKVQAFMAEIGQGDWSLPVAEFTVDRVLPKVEAVLTDLTAAQQRIKAGVSAYQQRCQAGLVQVQQFWQV